MILQLHPDHEDLDAELTLDSILDHRCSTGAVELRAASRDQIRREVDALPLARWLDEHAITLVRVVEAGLLADNIAGLMSDHPTPPIRAGAMLAPRSELSWLVLTRDQAQILYQLVRENRADITQRWSPGIWNGLSQALCDIDRADGAYIRKLPSPSNE